MQPIIAKSAGGLKVRIDTDSHVIVSDEPVDQGGAGEGPNPYDLLLASLGSCTVMTILMYARRKEWDVGEITVALTHESIHAQDCEDCESTQGKVTRIHREVGFTGDLTDEQRERLLEIAGHCPVSRALTREIMIVDSLAK